ncbi:MAG: cell division protein SepF [Clostridia bacterium]|nr:cell division protein SepF [Clostridia bacterium]
MSILGRKTTNAMQSDGYFDTNPLAEPESAAEPTPAPAPRPASGNIELKVVAPTEFEEVSTIADYLVDGCTVFLNVENTPRELVRRIIDFLSGVAYSIGGQIKKVTLTTYIITPDNVDVSDAATSRADD